jgi:hypothetical protein
VPGAAGAGDADAEHREELELDHMDIDTEVVELRFGGLSRPGIETPTGCAGAAQRPSTVSPAMGNVQRASGIEHDQALTSG